MQKSRHMESSLAEPKVLSKVEGLTQNDIRENVILSAARREESRCLDRKVHEFGKRDPSLRMTLIGTLTSTSLQRILSLKRVFFVSLSAGSPRQVWDMDQDGFYLVQIIFVMTHCFLPVIDRFLPTEH
jgi:hypothetical protein